jgi:hypothetical protein
MIDAEWIAAQVARFTPDDLCHAGRVLASLSQAELDEAG